MKCDRILQYGFTIIAFYNNNSFFIANFADMVTLSISGQSNNLPFNGSYFSPLEEY